MEREISVKQGAVMRASAARAARAYAPARPDHTSWMMTSLLLWLCALPLVGLLIFPWLGVRAAVIVAAGLLVASVVACYSMCAWQVAGPRRGADDE